jgi:hypothetical protein
MSTLKLSAIEGRTSSSGLTVSAGESGGPVEILGAKYNKYREEIVQAGTVNGVYNIDLETHANTLCIYNGGTITFTVSNFPTDSFVQLSMFVWSDGNNTSFPSGTVWTGGNVPVPSPTAWDCYTITSWDNVTWFGFSNTNFS